MYGIFSYIYHNNQPNVGKYTIHGFYWIYGKYICRLNNSKGKWKLNKNSEDVKAYGISKHPCSQGLLY